MTAADQHPPLLKDVMRRADIPAEYRGLLNGRILDAWHSCNDWHCETLEQFLVRSIAEGGLPAHYGVSLTDLEGELDYVRHPLFEETSSEPEFRSLITVTLVLGIHRHNEVTNDVGAAVDVAEFVADQVPRYYQHLEVVSCESVVANP